MDVRVYGSDELVGHKEEMGGNAQMSSALPQDLLPQQQECDSGRDSEVTCVWRWQVTLDFSLGAALLG